MIDNICNFFLQIVSNFESKYSKHYHLELLSNFYLYQSILGAEFKITIMRAVSSTTNCYNSYFPSARSKPNQT